MTDLRYPIGKFGFEAPSTERQQGSWIKEIAETPALLRQAVEGLDAEQLETPYREGGWTVRQVVHHIPDSHLNSYIRFRWALTEKSPIIKAYDEASWADLPDAKGADINLSLGLLESLHARWVVFLKSLNDDDYKRVFIHPESGKEISLERNLALYAWHGKHHIAHITSLRKRRGW